MLSSGDLERLIMVKRREIETEKMLLGLTSPDNNTTEDKENAVKPVKKVSYGPSRVLSERNDSSHDTTQRQGQETPPHLEEDIPADLERYIRRYVGLPVMLKAGEYSPNNPLIRGERSTGDALVGLGEYERRRNTLRKIRQRQYREYLDQQAKIKQEAKEKAERERREREERERLLEERERERQRELERHSPERRRASVNYTHVSGANNAYTTKVDTGVQVNNISRPLSVAVQTDDDELFRLTPSPKNLLTQAERELSPRMVIDPKDDRPIHPASWSTRDQWKDWKDQEKDLKDREINWKEQDKDWQDKGHWKDNGKDWQQLRKELENKGRNWKEEKEWKENREWAESKGEWGGYKQERRRSYGDFDERSKRASRDREIGKVSETRHTYKPSVFDADAIELRNLQAEKEAAARRQFYQQELKNQILEQQRIREERKTREKMLEQAEMRRLEQQLRSLRAAQEHEVDRHHELDTTIKDDAMDYERTRNTLQKEIDLEHQALLRATSNVKRVTQTSKSDTFPSKLPFYYPRVVEKTAKSLDPKEQRPPYSTNIPDNSIFSSNYDVDSYLRRNLNPTRESLSSNRLDTNDIYTKDVEFRRNTEPDDNRNVIIEKALVHDRPKPAERKIDRPKTLERPKIERSQIEPNTGLQVADPLPIPVLRHSPKRRTASEQERSDLSEAMQMVDDKWKVPVVQKNILKSMPNEEGKSVSILTQLGSIRRQLQLEQLKLDKMLSKDSDV